MKVYITWSGERGQILATFLDSLIKKTLKSVQPIVSSSDFQYWKSENLYSLNEITHSIICLTPENLLIPSILTQYDKFLETIKNDFVNPYLLGFSIEDIKAPTFKYRVLLANHDDTLRLLLFYNRIAEATALKEEEIVILFEKYWPKFHEKIILLLSQKGTFSMMPNPNLSLTKMEKHLLEAIIQKINTLPVLEKNTTKKSLRINNIFVVHGHNHGIKETVARVIEKMGAHVTILHEQPDQGKTIIEKLEKYSSINYAVVLLTKDDIGGTKDSDPDHLRYRARQNVIFELGYFIAKLGRHRVSVICEDGVEIPSDYAGVIYIQYDKHGSWKFYLGREIRTAGIYVNLNKLE